MRAALWSHVWVVVASLLNRKFRSRFSCFRRKCKNFWPFYSHLFFTSVFHISHTLSNFRCVFERNVILPRFFSLMVVFNSELFSKGNIHLFLWWSSKFTPGDWCERPKETRVQWLIHTGVNRHWNSQLCESIYLRVAEDNSIFGFCVNLVWIPSFSQASELPRKQLFTLYASPWCEKFENFVWTTFTLSAAFCLFVFDTFLLCCVLCPKKPCSHLKLLFFLQHEILYPGIPCDDILQVHMFTLRKKLLLREKHKQVRTGPVGTLAPSCILLQKSVAMLW